METLQDKCSKKLTPQINFIYQNTSLSDFLQVMNNHASNVKLEGRFTVEKQLNELQPAVNYPVFTKKLIPTVTVLDETTAGKTYRLNWNDPKNLEFWLEATINENHPEKSKIRGRGVPLDVTLTSLTYEEIFEIRWDSNSKPDFWCQITIFN